MVANYYFYLKGEFSKIDCKIVIALNGKKTQ